MKALIDTKADTLLERKAKTLIKTLCAVEAMKLLFTLPDTVCKTEAGKLRHKLANTC